MTEGDAATKADAATEDDVAALQGQLAAEHAAVYAYGALGADLGEQGRRPSETDPATAFARVSEVTHRARRDRLETAVRDRGAEPVPSAPAYRVARPVDDRADALALAPRVEDAVASAAAAGLARAATPAVRAVLVEAVVDASVRAARWRLAVRSTSDVTEAFPGG